jgi:hypothetical protein
MASLDLLRRHRASDRDGIHGVGSGCALQDVPPVHKTLTSAIVHFHVRVPLPDGRVWCAPLSPFPGLPTSHTVLDPARAGPTAPHDSDSTT